MNNQGVERMGNFLYHETSGRSELFLEQRQRDAQFHDTGRGLFPIYKIRVQTHVSKDGFLNT